MSDEATATAVAVAAPVELPAEGEVVSAGEGGALPERRGPGRPPGSKNRDRVASAERINKEADPLGFRLRALKRGWIKAAPSEGAQKREKILLTKDELLRLSQQLEDKVLPRLRSFEVTGDGVNNTTLTQNVFSTLSVSTTEGGQRAANLLRRIMLRSPDLAASIGSANQPAVIDAAE